MTEYLYAIVALAVVALLWRLGELWFKEQAAKRALNIEAAKTVDERLAVFQKALENSIKQFATIVEGIERARQEAIVARKANGILPGRMRQP